MNEVSCLYPVIIVSPTILHDALRSDRICINGSLRMINSSQRFELLQGFSAPGVILKVPFLQSVDEEFVHSHSASEVVRTRDSLNDFISNSYLVNSTTGETFPVYQYVPCGKCSVCNNAKLQSLIQRSQFAMEEAQKPAAFVTLTYNRYHLPNDMLVRKRHIELFKKRFKKNCAALYARIAARTIVDRELMSYAYIRSRRKELSSSSAKDIKFLVSSEYGKKGRPHYHMLIFGIPRLSMYDEEHDYFVRKLIQYCWRVPVRDEHTALFVDFDSYRLRYPRAVFKKGEIPRPDEIDGLSYGFSNYKEVSTSKCAKYVLKYCFKQFVDDDKRPRFKSVSQNLGFKFVKTYCKNIEDSDGKFRYMSHFDYSLKEVNLTGYYLRKLYPSFSNLVPASFRHDYLHCEYYGRVLISNKDVPLPIRHSVFGCLSLVRDICSPLVLFDEFKVFNFDLQKPSVIKVTENPITNVIQLDIDSQIPVYISEFYSSYSRLCSDSQSINWQYIFAAVNKRTMLFDKFKPRTNSQLIDVGRKFEKDIKVAFSKQVLA